MPRDDEDLLELDDEEVEAEETDDEEDDAADEVVASSDDDGADSASLDELLAQRAARRGSDEADEDLADILNLAPEPEKLEGPEPVPAKIAPIKEQEFVCARCHLVKPRVQLADRDRRLCRDCA